MTLVNGKMANQSVAESYRVPYTSTPRKHTKAGHVVTFSSQKSYASNTSKDSSDDEDDEYFNRRPPSKDASAERQNFEVIKTLNEGRFSKILLAKLDGTGINKERMVLKAVEQQSASSVHTFYKEMDYHYLLSAHENVVTSYNVVLKWRNYYIFAQEYAPVGDLGKYLKKYGALTEAKTKLVAKQLSSALDFIHGSNLVHQAVTPSNVMVFNKECTLIKLTDFCIMRPSGSLVMKGSPERYLEDGDDISYTPPEVYVKLAQEKHHLHTSIDVWAVGIIIWACLSGTGQGPWRAADVLRDLNYRTFFEWTKKKTLKVPDVLQPFTYRFRRLIKRLLEPKAEKRCKAREVHKYLKDEWLSSSASKNTAAVLTKLGMSRSESCTFGSQSVPTVGGFGRANSQKYARRASVCPRKSEIRKTRRQESNGSSSSNNNNPSAVANSPRPRAAEETNRSFKISCFLETQRVVPLTNSKSSSCIIPPPSPTPQQQSPLPPLPSKSS